MMIPDAKAAVDKEWKKTRDDPIMTTGKVKSKKVVTLEAQRDKKKSSLLRWWQERGVRPKITKKKKGRVVFRGDIVKDDSGVCAVLTEQDLSASQMTAAKVMDVIARLAECDGQADAVSASTQVKLEDAPRLLKIP